MAAKKFISEDDIEQALLQRLQHLCGFNVLNCFTAQPDDLNDGSGRADKREVILTGPLRAALERLNPQAPASAVDEALAHVRQPRTAMSLVAAFFFMAGIYVLLSAHLIAFMQILVYAGAVMVLFLFVIMLLSLGNEGKEHERYKAMQLLGTLGAIGLVALVASASREVAGADQALVAADFGTVKAVGRALFTQYLLPFEATSLLLLVAIVGAVVVAKEKI